MLFAFLAHSQSFKKTKMMIVLRDNTPLPRPVIPNLSQLND